MENNKFHEIGMEVLTRKIKERVKLITEILITELENESVIEYIYNTSEKALKTINESDELNRDPSVQAMILDDVVKETSITIAKSIINKLDEEYQNTLTDMDYQAKRLKYVDDKIKNLSPDDLKENANKTLKEFLKNMGQS